MFKTFFSNLAQNLVFKLPTAPNKFNKSKVASYYKNDDTNKLTFAYISRETVLKILMSIDTAKSAGIDNLNGRFLKYGAEILASPIAQLCNLSIQASSFPDCCKTAKLKPL